MTIHKSKGWVSCYLPCDLDIQSQPKGWFKAIENFPKFMVNFNESPLTGEEGQFCVKLDVKLWS